MCTHILYVIEVNFTLHVAVVIPTEIGERSLWMLYAGRGHTARWSLREGEAQNTTEAFLCLGHIRSVLSPCGDMTGGAIVYCNTVQIFFARLSI